MLSRTIAVAASVLVAGSALAQSHNQVKSDPVQAYWSQFGAPDLRIDVQSALDQNGTFVFNGTIANQNYELFWISDGKQGEFAILVDGKTWIDDLVSGVDHGFRPMFAGQFDAFGQAAVTGFVDVSPDGFLVVQLNIAGSDPVRATVSQGSTVALATCICFGTAQNKKECTDSDCDVSEQCHGTGDPVGSAHCRWKAGQVADAAVGLR